MDAHAVFPEGPFSYRQAVAAGVPRPRLRRAVEDGRVRRLTRNVYTLPVPLDPSAERWELARSDHLRRVKEALARFPTSVASHSSAALLHGLELVVSPHAEVEITVVDAVPRSRRHPGVVLHHADSTPTGWVETQGIRATTLARTAADVLRTRRHPHAVAMLDRALTSGLLSREEVVAELDRQRRWRGRPRALRSMSLVDTARESWLESYSLVALHELGMPLPLAQVDILDEAFSFVGRVDGLVPGGVFLEADGEGKYFLDADPAHPLSELVQRRLAAEQLRHRRLEELGLVGVRWGGPEIMSDPAAVLYRVNDARRRALHQTFRGWVRWEGRVVRMADLPWVDEPQ